MNRLMLTINTRYQYGKRICLTFVSCVMLLTGCQPDVVRQDVVDNIEDTVNRSISDNANQASVPENVSDSLIPSISLESERLLDIEDESRFDISVNAVPADQFFLSLVDGTDYNMVVHPEVSGTITLNLRNVTIPDVMEAARDVYGYEFVNTDYGFQVLPGRLRARIYQINYLNVERNGRSQTTVSSGSLTGGDSGSSQSTSGGTTRSSRILGTDITTRQSLTSFWTELADSVKAIVGAGQGRSVVVNPQSGVVVVRALPNELREVETYLQATQLIVQRQVILEAKFIEVRLNDDFQSGINWGALFTPGNNSITAANVGGGSVLVNEGGLSNLAGNSGNLDPNNLSQIAGATAAAFGGVFSLALELGDFNAFIELLKKQGNVQVLSSPRVSTMNNQKAIIKVGTDEYFVTDITTTNVATAATTTINPNIELTPFFSGIALDVTPQISQEGDVTLHVHPSISEVVDQQKTVTLGDDVQQIPLALSTVRESDSIIRAKSGQVVVIGGLMQETTNDQTAKTPILGDIPGVGKLFRHKKETSVKSELVILLKPIVVNDTDDWNEELYKSRRNIRELREEMRVPESDTFLNDLFSQNETY